MRAIRHKKGIDQGKTKVGMKNRTKAIANSVRKGAEKELTNLNLKPNNIFKVKKFVKKDGKDIKGEEEDA